MTNELYIWTLPIKNKFRLCVEPSILCLTLHKACRAQMSAGWHGEVAHDPRRREPLCSWCSNSFSPADQTPRGQWLEARKVSQGGLIWKVYLGIGERYLFAWSSDWTFVIWNLVSVFFFLIRPQGFYNLCLIQGKYYTTYTIWSIL